MGRGPVIMCDKCGRSFFGGRGYKRGRKNYCPECLVPLVNTITPAQYEELGIIQRGYINMIHSIGGHEVLGGEKKAIQMLKVNAGELDPSVLD